MAWLAPCLNVYTIQCEPNLYFPKSLHYRNFKWASWRTGCFCWYQGIADKNLWWKNGKCSQCNELTINESPSMHTSKILFFLLAASFQMKASNIGQICLVVLLKLNDCSVVTFFSYMWICLPSVNHKLNNQRIDHQLINLNWRWKNFEINIYVFFKATNNSSGFLISKMGRIHRKYLSKNNKKQKKLLKMLN